MDPILLGLIALSALLAFRTILELPKLVLVGLACVSSAAAFGYLALEDPAALHVAHPLALARARFAHASASQPAPTSAPTQTAAPASPGSGDGGGQTSDTDAVLARMAGLVSDLQSRLDGMSERDDAMREQMTNAMHRNVKASGKVYEAMRVRQASAGQVGKLRSQVQALAQIAETQEAEMSKARSQVNALSAEEHRVRDIEARIEKLSRHGKAQAGVIKAARSEVATLKEAAAALSSAATTAATTAAHPAAASKAGDRGGRGTGTGGAFAVLANNDWGSVASAMAVVDMLRQYRTRFDVLVVTPEPLDPHFASQVRRLRATPVSLGHTTYPPHFKPKRPAFRICWHKLGLWKLDQYAAVVALDSDILVRRNIDTLIEQILDDKGGPFVWFAAHDETPICEDCNAEVSGAPNAGVFGLVPSRKVYDALVERSRSASPWYGQDWAYSEQELLSVYFLVERQKQKSRIVWYENVYNSFACKYHCPNRHKMDPAVVHFVGVDKPTAQFCGAKRRSQIIKGLAKIDPSYPFIAEVMRPFFKQWFEHWARAQRSGGTQVPQLEWKAQEASPKTRPWLGFLHTPKTGGTSLVSALMQTLFGEWWYHLECQASSGADLSAEQPPLCATYGNWTAPRKRAPDDLLKCPALGCLGHLPYVSMKRALGPDLLPRAMTVILLRDPVALFVSEYYYILTQIERPSPSLQFVTDLALLRRMERGMTLNEYVEYWEKVAGLPAAHADGDSAALGIAPNRQTFFITSASASEMRDKADAVFWKAAGNLLHMDVIAITEDMQRSANLIKCTLGIQADIKVPSSNVGKYPRLNDAILTKRIKRINHLDVRVYEFARGVFASRQAAVPMMRDWYSHCGG